MHPGPGRLDSVTALFVLARELRRQVGELLAGEKWLAEAGFRPPCIGVLSCVAEVGPASQRAISDHLGVDASDVVGVLDILETAHLVERQRDPEDRRRHAVVLTPQGHRAAQRLASLRAEAEARVLSRLSAEERRLLGELLSRAVARDEPAASGDQRPGGLPAGG